MPFAQVACPKCQRNYQISSEKMDFIDTCTSPQCASVLELHAYPLIFQPLELGARAATLTDDTEAGCFFHPQNQAVQECKSCGRFLCALCSVPINSEIVCPNCLANKKKKGQLGTLEERRICYDRVVLSIGILSFLIFPLSFIGFPCALFLGIRYCNAPGSIVGGTKRLLMILGILLSIAPFLVTLLYIFALILGIGYGSHFHKVK